MSDNIGVRINEARKNAGFSQRQLASLAKTSASMVMRWEHGESIPRNQSLKKLADALNVSLGWLKTGVGSPQQSEPFPLFSKLSEQYKFHPKSIAPWQMVSLPHYENENHLYQIPLYSLRNVEEEEQQKLFWITSADIAKYGNIPQRYGKMSPDDIFVGIRDCDYKQASRWYLWLVEVNETVHLASLHYRQNTNTGFVVLKDNNQKIDDLNSIHFLAAIIGSFAFINLRSDSEYYVPFWGASSEWFFDSLHHEVGIEEIKDDKLSSRLHSVLSKARKESGIKMTWEQEAIIYWKMYKFCIDNQIGLPVPPTADELKRMLHEWT